VILEYCRVVDERIQLTEKAVKWLIKVATSNALLMDLRRINQKINGGISTVRKHCKQVVDRSIFLRNVAETAFLPLAVGFSWARH